MRWIRQVFITELRKIMAYRWEFWINFFGQTVLSIIIAYFLWFNIYEQRDFETINGFTFKNIILFYTLAPIINRIQQGDMIGHISKEIYEGGLNKFIVYPVNFFTFKITTYLTHSFFFLIQLFLVMTLYFTIISPELVYIVSITKIIIITITLALAAITYFCFNAICELVAFWADYIWSLGVIMRFIIRFLGGGWIPIAFFPAWSSSYLEYLPFQYMINFPLEVLLKGKPFSDIVTAWTILLVWIMICSIIIHFMWNAGKKKYTGIGI